MNQELRTYIETKRQQGISDEQIGSNLVASGWSADIVQAHLQADLNDAVPAPPTPVAPVNPQNQDPKIDYGSYGIEYMIMMLALWISASSLGSLLHSLVGSLVASSSEDYNFGDFFNIAATAGLLVSLPVFTFLFFRLRKLEIENSLLRRNGLRKFSIYAALVVAFLTGIGRIVWSVFILMSGGLFGQDYNPVIELFHISITLLIAGTIFAYYLRDIRLDPK